MNIVVTYCERVHTGVFGEPLNTLSNIAYLIAAGLLYYNRPQSKKRDPAQPILTVLLMLVGLGSAAFHALPTSLTLLLDVVPIFLTMLFFCWLIQTRLLQHSLFSVVTSQLVLLSSTLYLTGFSAFANGSLMYLPAALYSVLAVALLPNEIDSKPLKLAAALLLIALTTRTMDNRVCSVAPMGTHFIWHIITAIACYIAAGSVIKQPQRQ